MAAQRDCLRRGPAADMNHGLRDQYLVAVVACVDEGLEQVNRADADDGGAQVSEDGGANWVEGNDGMARVPVFEIRGYEWNPWEGMSMYIGTHGRGYFKSTTLLTGTKNIASNKLNATVAPNPTSDLTQISFTAYKSGIAILSVYDLSGKVVLTQNIQIVKLIVTMMNL